MIETLVVIGAAAVAIPFTLYLTAKLITYGVLAGRDRFRRDHPNSNGGD